MKKIVLFFILIFLLNLVNAFSLQASPDEIFIETTVGEKICKDITLFVSEESEVIIADRWAEEGFNEKVLTAHDLSSDDLLITPSYQKEFNVKKEEKVSFCFSAKKEGFYHGILLIKGKGYPVGIGVWVNFNVTKRSTLFTGLAINETKQKNPSLIFLLIFVVIVLAEVFILVRKKRDH